MSARAGEAELVVHRRQLLLIMKLAIEHCPASGLDLLAAPPGYFGTILLMANDQFHYGLYPFPQRGSADERENVSRVMAEFVPVAEYAGFGMENRIVRSHLMMTTYTDRLASHPDFVDVARAYRERTGIALEDHEALTFGVFTRCDMVTLAGLQQNARLAVLREDANRSYDGDDHRDNEPSYDDDDRGRSGRSHDRDADEDDDDRGPREFSTRERRIISDCFVENRSNLPPGLAKRDRLPPGLERQLERNGTSAARAAKTRAAASRLLRRSATETAAGLGTGCARRPDYSARPEAEDS